MACRTVMRGGHLSRRLIAHGLGKYRESLSRQNCRVQCGGVYKNGFVTALLTFWSAEYLSRLLQGLSFRSWGRDSFSWRESQHNIPKRGRGSLSISRVERGRSSMKDMDVSVIRVRLHGGGISRGKLFGGGVLAVCLPNLKCRLHLVGFFLLITKLVVSPWFKFRIKDPKKVSRGFRQQVSVGV